MTMSSAPTRLRPTAVAHFAKLRLFQPARRPLTTQVTQEASRTERWIYVDTVRLAALLNLAKS